MFKLGHFSCGFYTGAVFRKRPEVSPQSNNPTSRSRFVEKFRGMFAGMTLPTVAARIKSSIKSLASCLRRHPASPAQEPLTTDSILASHSAAEAPAPAQVTDQNIPWGSANIGITGAASTGKSSLINALSGRKESDPDAVCVTENGSGVARGGYMDKANKALVYQEFPVHSQSTHQNDLLKCDVVFHALGDRLLESDVKTIEFLQKNKKPFHLVRTKCDLAVQQVQRREKGMSKEEAERRLRSDLSAFLRQNNLTIADTSILFVSSWDISKSNNAFDGKKIQGMINDQRINALLDDAPGPAQLRHRQNPVLPVKPVRLSFIKSNDSWLYSKRAPQAQGLRVSPSSELASPTRQVEAVSQKPTLRKSLTDYLYAPFRQ